MNTLAEFILTQGQLDPDGPAIIDQNASRTTTYQELLNLAYQIAHYTQSLPPISRVVCTLPRSAEYMASLVAMNLLGIGVGLLTEAEPEARLSQIMEKLGTQININSAFLEQAKEHSASPIPCQGTPQTEAFFVFTSGSTGKPKGVIYNNYAISCAVKRNADLFQFQQNFAHCSTSSFSFSAITMDGFPALSTAGVCLHLPDDVTRKDPLRLVDYINAQQISTCSLPPQLLNGMTQEMPSLKTIFVGSEKVTNTAPRNYRMFCTYAQTETTVAVSAFQINQTYSNTPIGKALPGMSIYLLDEENNPVSEGEICVAGPVASGYLEQPELTAKVFVANPFSTGEQDKIMVRTGDLGRRLEDGNILYLNRRDWMVKVDGFRVEPGEVEACLMALPQLEKALVHAFVNGKNQTYLCGYYTVNTPVSEEEIRAHIKANLPPYMQPKYLVLLDAVPLNANGKVDRLSLKSPEDSLAQIPFAPPETPEEAAICDAFAQLLELDQVGRNDDFFRLGGDSVKTTLLLHRLDYPGLSTIDIMLGKTPAGVAKIVGSLQEKKQEDSLYQDLPQGVEIPSVPLTELQLQWYLFEFKRPESTTSNLSINYTLDRTMGIDGKTLVNVVDQALANHPGLFSRIVPTDQGVSMIFTGISPICQHITVKEEEIPALQQDFIRRFDFTKGPLCRATVAETESHLYLWLNVHHIVFDGSSMALFNEELGKLLQGQPIQPETISPFALYELEQRRKASPKYQEDLAFF